MPPPGKKAPAEDDAALLGALAGAVAGQAQSDAEARLKKAETENKQLRQQVGHVVTRVHRIANDWDDYDRTGLPPRPTEDTPRILTREEMADLYHSFLETQTRMRLLFTTIERDGAVQGDMLESMRDWFSGAEAAGANIFRQALNMDVDAGATDALLIEATNAAHEAETHAAQLHESLNNVFREVVGKAKQAMGDDTAIKRQLKEATAIREASEREQEAVLARREELEQRAREVELRVQLAESKALALEEAKIIDREDWAKSIKEYELKIDFLERQVAQAEMRNRLQEQQSRTSVDRGELEGAATLSTPSQFEDQTTKLEELQVQVEKMGRQLTERTIALQKLELQVPEMAASHAEETKALREEIKDRLHRKDEAHGRALEEAERLRRQLQNELDEQREQAEDMAAGRIQVACDQVRGECARQQEVELRRLREELETDHAEAADGLTAEIERLQLEVVQATERYDALAEHVDGVQAAADMEALEMADMLAKTAEEQEALATQSTAALDRQREDLVQLHEAKLAELSRAADAEQARLRAELDRLRKRKHDEANAHEEALYLVQQELAAANATIEELRKQHAAAMAEQLATMRDNDKKAAAAYAKYRADELEVKAQLAAAEAQVVELRAVIESQQKQLTKMTQLAERGNAATEQLRTQQQEFEEELARQRQQAPIDFSVDVDIGGDMSALAAELDEEFAAQERRDAKKRRKFKPKVAASDGDSDDEPVEEPDAEAQAQAKDKDKDKEKEKSPKKAKRFTKLARRVKLVNTMSRITKKEAAAKKAAAKKEKAAAKKAAAAEAEAAAVESEPSDSEEAESEEVSEDLDDAAAEAPPAEAEAEPEPDQDPDEEPDQDPDEQDPSEDEEQEDEEQEQDHQQDLADLESRIREQMRAEVEAAQRAREEEEAKAARQKLPEGVAELQDVVTAARRELRHQRHEYEDRLREIRIKLESTQIHNDRLGEQITMHRRRNQGLAEELRRRPPAPTRAEEVARAAAAQRKAEEAIRQQMAIEAETKPQDGEYQAAAVALLDLLQHAFPDELVGRAKRVHRRLRKRKLEDGEMLSDDDDFVPDPEDDDFVCAAASMGRAAAHLAEHANPRMQRLGDALADQVVEARARRAAWKATVEHSERVDEAEQRAAKRVSSLKKTLARRMRALRSARKRLRRRRRYSTSSSSDDESDESAESDVSDASFSSGSLSMSDVSSSSSSSEDGASDQSDQSDQSDKDDDPEIEAKVDELAPLVPLVLPELNDVIEEGLPPEEAKKRKKTLKKKKRRLRKKRRQVHRQRRQTRALLKSQKLAFEAQMARMQAIGEEQGEEGGGEEEEERKEQEREARVQAKLAALAEEEPEVAGWEQSEQSEPEQAPPDPDEPEPEPAPEPAPAAPPAEIVYDDDDDDGGDLLAAIDEKRARREREKKERQRKRREKRKTAAAAAAAMGARTDADTQTDPVQIFAWNEAVVGADTILAAAAEVEQAKPGELHLQLSDIAEATSDHGRQASVRSVSSAASSTAPPTPRAADMSQAEAVAAIVLASAAKAQAQARGTAAAAATREVGTWTDLAVGADDGQDKVEVDRAVLAAMQARLAELEARPPTPTVLTPAPVAPPAPASTAAGPQPLDLDALPAAISAMEAELAATRAMPPPLDCVAGALRVARLEALREEAAALFAGVEPLAEGAVGAGLKARVAKGQLRALDGDAAACAARLRDAVASYGVRAMLAGRKEGAADELAAAAVLAALVEREGGWQRAVFLADGTVDLDVDLGWWEPETQVRVLTAIREFLEAKLAEQARLAEEQKAKLRHLLVQEREHVREIARAAQDSRMADMEARKAFEEAKEAEDLARAAAERWRDAQEQLRHNAREGELSSQAAALRAQVEATAEAARQAEEDAQRAREGSRRILGTMHQPTIDVHLAVAELYHDVAVLCRPHLPADLHDLVAHSSEVVAKARELHEGRAYAVTDELLSSALTQDLAVVARVQQLVQQLVGAEDAELEELRARAREEHAALVESIASRERAHQSVANLTSVIDEQRAEIARLERDRAAQADHFDKRLDDVVAHERRLLEEKMSLTLAKMADKMALRALERDLRQVPAEEPGMRVALEHAQAKRRKSLSGIEDRLRRVSQQRVNNVQLVLEASAAHRASTAFAARRPLLLGDWLARRASNTPALRFWALGAQGDPNKRPVELGGPLPPVLGSSLIGGAEPVAVQLDAWRPTVGLVAGGRGARTPPRSPAAGRSPRSRGRQKQPQHQHQKPLRNKAAGPPTSPVVRGRASAHDRGRGGGGGAPSPDLAITPSSLPPVRASSPASPWSDGPASPAPAPGWLARGSPSRGSSRSGSRSGERGAADRGGAVDRRGADRRARRSVS